MRRPKGKVKKLRITRNRAYVLWNGYVRDAISILSLWAVPVVAVIVEDVDCGPGR